MTPSTAPTMPHVTRQEKVFTLVGTLLGMLLAALDQTIVATAGPQIQKDLSIAPSLYAWITTAYLVASTVMIPIYGKLSDLLGRKVILTVGIVIFVLGSVLCGVADSAWFLILARAVQGLGSAALFTSAFAIIADLYPPAERGRISGLFGAVFGLSSVLGPLVGGFITDTLSWHWAFFINLPLGLLALAFVLLRMPLLKHDFHEGQVRPRVDYLGAFWLVAGVVPLLLALSLGKTTIAPGDTGLLWNSWPMYGLFALAVIGVVAFLATERRAPDPILDLTLFKNRTFAVGNLASFLIGAAFLGPIIFLPLFMVNVVGLSATNSGLTITPLSLGIVAGNILSGQIVSRFGKYKPLLMTSLVLLMIAFVVVGWTLDTNATQASVTLKMVLIGLGLGPSIPIYTLAIQNAVDPRKTGVATSSATFFRSLGNVVGVAVLGTVFANVLTHQLAGAQARVRADLPPSMRAQLTEFSVGGEGSAATVDVNRIKREVSAELDAQKTTITKALRDGDPASVRRLLSDERTPRELRAALERGGIRARVRQEFERQEALLTRALRDNDVTAIRALLASPGTPSPVRALLEANGARPEIRAARRAALPQAIEGLRRAEIEAARLATDTAVARATRAIDEATPRIMQALDAFGQGFKEALAAAVSRVFRDGFVIVLLGFLVTIFLPQLPLRRRNEPPGSPASD